MEARKKVLGLEHPNTLSSMANLVYTLNDQDRRDETLPLMISCLKLRREVLRELHSDTQSALATLVTWLDLQDDIEGETKDNSMPEAW